MEKRSSLLCSKLIRKQIVDQIAEGYNFEQSPMQSRKSISGQLYASAPQFKPWLEKDLGTGEEAQWRNNSKGCLKALIRIGSIWRRHGGGDKSEASFFIRGNGAQ